MSLTSVVIRRPVFTTMLVAAPMVLGLASYGRLGVDLLPNADVPVVSVTTTLAGAGVEEMESSVTKRLEEAINTVSGIEDLNSITREGLSNVTVLFELEKEGTVAAQEVRDKVSAILATLPSGTQAPIVDRFDLGSSPVLTLAVSGERSFREVSELADKQLRPGLESVSGVGRVTIAGARTRAIAVDVDAARLEAYALSIEQVRQALLAQNVELPGGRVDQPGRELVLRTMGRVTDRAGFEELIITTRGGHPIRLKDVARVSDTVEEPRSLSQLDGRNAVSVVIQKQSGENTVQVIRNVQERLEELLPALPRDLRVQAIRDQSVFVQGSIREVQKHLVLGAILVALTILLFLRDWRTMLIASTAIPVSIVSTFAFMDVMGFTLNNITLLGLVLAVGIVIDDAVVVHENIFRWMEEKREPAESASRHATEEIALAVLATTASLVVIFLPIAFMGGIVGRFFKSFGLTIAMSIVLSLGVSFTLTPMLCARYLRHDPAKGPTRGGLYARLFERPYMALLRWSMRRRWVVVAAALAVFACTPLLFMAVGKSFVPKDDTGEFEVAVTAPPGWSLDRTAREMEELDRAVRGLRGVDHTLLTVGDTSGRAGKGAGDVTKASLFVKLAPFGQRIHSRVDRLLALGPAWLERLAGVDTTRPEVLGVSQFDVMREARAVCAAFPDLRTSVQVPAIAQNGQPNADVQFHLLGPSILELDRLSQAILARMRQVPGVRDADTTLAFRKPELRVVVHREKAMDLGVSVTTLASTLQTLVGGQVVGTFKDAAAGEQYDVWLRAIPRDRDDPSTIERLTVPSSRAGLVRVSNLASLEPARGPSQIDRLDRQRKVTILANCDGIPIGTAKAAVDRIVEEVGLPAGYSVQFTGSAKTMADTMSNFATAFILSFIFMYIVLAAQFESFVHPATILLSLPLTIPFAIASLLLLGQPLDIYSVFGLFLLFGVVKKNGILVVDYANGLRARGVPRDEAILEANQTRLRPILMTTVMLIAGMIPIALGVGPGTASRASIAMVIIGGQTLSLVLSLLVTPVAYTYFDDVTRWWNGPSQARGDLPHAEPVVQ